jgi:hypothetical protein
MSISLARQVFIKQGSGKYFILAAKFIEDMEKEYRPDGEQFTERSASDQAFGIGSSVDLVGNIRAFVDQERERQGGNFNAAWFLRSNLRSLYHAAPDTEQEKALFFDDLHIAWGLVAWDALEGHQDTVYGETQTYASVMQRFERLHDKKLQVSPLGVAMLDAMAEAIGLEHTPGQDTFDLSLFDSMETMARIDRGLVPEGHIYPLPTSQEVKMAFTKSVDTNQD